MNRVSWFSYRHPFVAAVLAGVFGTALASIYGVTGAWSLATGVVTMAVILAMWWPRKGALSRDVDDWLSDEDPRVRKPDRTNDAE
jgi:hypothetical protein